MGFPSRKIPEESKSNAKLISELKSENHKLRRQVKRLERQVEKGLREDFVDEEGDADLAERVDSRFDCPSCNSGMLETVNLGIKSLRVCRKCKYRQVT